ncbi:MULTISPECIES: hypothetical protein [Kyrpidia]|uniref:Uncharacterized protein n=2 Tax=Kyrpidia spormannii TaxID=2055160 RepID=A0ACA8ZEV9_9BACL|nr:MULTISPECIES: hypothetical protein [Kyrpidia]MCL6575798.1 hypothetical protein [Kyrpidia sp.]CAB3394412.1 conserved protein of unknown function [Kyrpidia spormannii]CAB3395355.1 conserved protein of unknown function [Kyrpidia spormannii]
MQDPLSTGRRTDAVRSDVPVQRESDPAKEDIEEGMDRMMNEGGGVVDHYHEHVPVLRNDLVNVDENPGAE